MTTYTVTVYDEIEAAYLRRLFRRLLSSRQVETLRQHPPALRVTSTLSPGRFREVIARRQMRGLISRYEIALASERKNANP